MSPQKKSENTSEIKACRIKYSLLALRDMDRVWIEVYQASQSYEITTAYMEELIDAIEAKALFPYSGAPLYCDNSFTGYYFVVFKAYIAFYRMDKEDMLVDRVLFGKSDYLQPLGF